MIRLAFQRKMLPIKYGEQIGTTKVRLEVGSLVRRLMQQSNRDSGDLRKSSYLLERTEQWLGPGCREDPFQMEHLVHGRVWKDI